MLTKIGQLSQELARTNPWWRGPDWQARDPDLRRAEMSELSYESPALCDLPVGNVYVLRGPRRVGKTVAVKQRIARLIADGVEPRAIVRVAADGWDDSDIRNLPQTPRLPRLADGTRRWWFIDEASAVKGDWAAQVKWLRDNDPEFSLDTVVLSGSDAPALTEAIGRLSGRRGRNDDLARTMLPIGFRTFVTLTEFDVPSVDAIALDDVHSPRAREAIDALLPWLDILVHAWETYLEYGGFPVSVSAAKRGDALPTDFANDLFDVVFRDAFAASNLSESKTAALYSRVVEGMGNPVNITSIANDLGIPFHTVVRHTEYLRDSFLSWTCSRRAENTWLALEGAQEKIYASDPLLARLMHVRNQHRPDVDPTILAEMQIGMAIRRRQVAAGATWTGEDRLFYWRTPTRKEIDFVSEDLGGAAVEGKYTEQRWRQESATVNASQWRGVLATRNVLDTDSRDKAWAVPAALLAYIIDT